MLIHVKKSKLGMVLVDNQISNTTNLNKNLPNSTTINLQNGRDVFVSFLPIDSTQQASVIRLTNMGDKIIVSGQGVKTTRHIKSGVTAFYTIEFLHTSEIEAPAKNNPPQPKKAPTNKLLIGYAFFDYMLDKHYEKALTYLAPSLKRTSSTKMFKEYFGNFSRVKPTMLEGFNQINTIALLSKEEDDLANNTIYSAKSYMLEIIDGLIENINLI
ncbi:MAG: hypothetical protein FWB72_06245 [Firmicutes bacterium]|nr:hypothetical protein [Bacillota bacterium]